MPRPRPPYLSHERTRHSKSVWYVRRNGKRVRIKAAFGTPEFDAEYQAAIAGTSSGTSSTRAATTKAAHGTLAWLIDRYRETYAWTSLSPATRDNRDRHFRQSVKYAGDAPVHEIAKSSIIASRERRSATPAQARNFLDAMRGLFRWALEADHIAVDPTEGVKNSAAQG